MKLDLKPDVREMDDGRIGYFYSPQQLEEIRQRNINGGSVDDIKNMGYRISSPLTRYRKKSSHGQTNGL